VEKSRSWIIGVVVSVTALVIAFWGVRPGRLLDALSGANYFFLVPASFTILLGLAARSRSWQILLNNRISLRRTFDALNEGYLLNTVLPFRLGELARSYIVSQVLGSSAGAILATVLLERVIDTSVSFVGLIVALPFVISPTWTTNLVWGVAVILLLIILGVAILLSQRKKLVSFMGKLPGMGFWGLDQAADEFIGSLESLMDLKRLLLAGFWSMAAWATTWVQLWLLLQMFSIQGSIVVSLFVSGVIAFGAAIPSSPGALGVFELSAIAGLLVFGVSRESALSFAIVAHLLQLSMTGLFGSWALAREGRTILGLAERTREFIRKARNRQER
jgi:uncharacterized protein (TIRG00374 family)